MKKLISMLSLAVLSIGLFPGLALAAAIIPQDLIQNITLAVSGNSATSFQPANGQLLDVNVDFNTENFASGLTNSSGYVIVKKDGITIKTLAAWTNSNVTGVTVADWNGRDIDSTAAAQGVCGNSGAICPVGNYTIEGFVSYTSGADTFIDTHTTDFTLGAPNTLTVSSFTATAPGGTFDPAPSADNEDLTITYTLNQTPDQVSVIIKDSKNNQLKTFSSTSATTSFTWDGVFANKLVLPGTYTVELTATKSGSANATSTQSFTVAYNHQDKGDIIDFGVIPTSFDPDFEDAIIEFKNTEDANLTVEIQNVSGDKMRSFDDYDHDNYNENSVHSISWDGRNNSGSVVSLATYKVIVISRNEFGVVVKETTITVDNSGGSIDDSNAHISGISFHPSSVFDPAEDDELVIDFDVKMDLDELVIFAVRGDEKIELFNEDDVEEEDNLEITWDGTDDDDEYVAKGSWRIQFESKKGSTSLIAAKSISVDYQKPLIDDLYISKDPFDNDLNEFAYILFRVDAEALVTITVLESGNEDDEIEEDMEVEADKWYAVQWDGDNYDYDDDLEIKLVAANKVNEDVFDSEKIDVDLAEDDVSSTKSNVTEDFISPVVTDGDENMILFYNLEDEADVTITIHKGETAAGTAVIELLDIEDQAAGDHSISWNGRDDDGDELSNGIYSYKIVSDKSSTDTEKGVFVVGPVGEVDGSSADSDDDSNSDGSNVSPNVIVDGVSYDNVPTTSDCGNFPDVLSSYEECEAIEWTKDAGIFQGYADGTFGIFTPINRVELLAVILRTMDFNIDYSATGNLGFTDVIVGAWYIPYISTAKNLGIFQGDAGTYTARPGDTVNRAEASKMIFEALRIMTGVNLATTCEQPYGDVLAGVWYYNYACAAETIGLFNIYYDNLMPANLSNRGEIAMALYRLHLAGWL